MENRLTIKQMFLNAIDNQPRGYAEILAKIAGYSSGSNLKKILTNPDKEFDKFYGFVEMVKFQFGEDEHKLMEQYSTEIDPNKQTARCMLEYMASHRLLDSMKELIDKMMECKNKESYEYAKIYSLQYEWQMNYHCLDIEIHLKNINNIHTSIKELDVYLNLMKCHGYYFKDSHNRAYEIAQELINDIKDISNDYIRTVYEAKLSEILSYINLWVLNNPEQARIHANTVIDSKIGKTHEAYSLYTIGLSHFYTSYDNALRFLLNSVDIYKSIKRDLAAKDVQEYIEKLNVFWDKDLSDHYFIAQDNKLLYRFKKGENISSSLEDLKNVLDEPYYYYLKGLVNNNRDDFMESLIIFIDRGDTFWANLAKIELLKLGENERVLNRLMNINKA